MHLVIDSNLYSIEEFGASFDFMLAHGLIEVKEYLQSYKIAFVGEVLTPFHHFVSLPKNFTNRSEENAQLILDILREFKNVKKNGKLLISNKSYQIGNEIESDFYYWQKFFSYFIDYITYEFYYPRERSIIHSLRKQHGRLNPMLTELNRDQFGNGITYEVKDHKNNYVRNVFYSVLKSLESQFASEVESKKISEIEIFLRNKDVKFLKIDVDEKAFLEYIKKLQTNPIHEIIVKTLIHYFMRLKITEKNTINVFYTREFEYLYEYLLQKVLKHNVAFKNSNWSNPDFKTLYPDIINESFIGDVKYYRIGDLDKNSFEKELYAYNIANHNSQPNFILIPSEEKKYWKKLTHSIYNVQVIIVDLRTILYDYKEGKDTVLNYIRTLI